MSTPIINTIKKQMTMATIKVTTTLKLEGTAVSVAEKEFNCPKQAAEYVQARRAEAENLFPSMKFREGTHGFVGYNGRTKLIVKVERLGEESDPILAILLLLFVAALIEQAEAEARQPQVVGVGLVLIH